MKYGLFSIALMVSFLLTSNFIYAQKVSFAKDVKPSGEMVGQSSKFYFPKGENNLKMLVNLAHKVGTDSVTYKVYRLGAKDSRYLDQTITDAVKPEWFWFPEDVLIRSQGKYLVEVYGRGYDKIIATGTFSLEWTK